MIPDLVAGLATLEVKEHFVAGCGICNSVSLIVWLVPLFLSFLCILLWKTLPHFELLLGHKLRRFILVNRAFAIMFVSLGGE